ncbi:MAG: hypothetical protein PWQ82_624 [Thermosediminibacterales bacterium]|nr:hypothetical protein [Thermosediminibacterales bacterium]MDK2836477.1 hypothetical protein [Thermosediminibacterales bacterium]
MLYVCAVLVDLNLVKIFKKILLIKSIFLIEESINLCRIINKLIIFL